MEPIVSSLDSCTFTATNWRSVESRICEQEMLDRTASRTPPWAKEASADLEKILLPGSVVECDGLRWVSCRAMIAGWYWWIRSLRSSQWVGRPLQFQERSEQSINTRWFEAMDAAGEDEQVWFEVVVALVFCRDELGDFSCCYAWYKDDNL